MILWIPGIPKATQTGSVIRAKGRAFPVRRNTAWSSYVRLAIAQSGAELLDGPLVVSICFVLPDLASGKRAMPITRPDLDNLLKGLLDCGNGILWHDDAQIVDLIAVKRYAKHTVRQQPGVEITVRRRMAA